MRRFCAKRGPLHLPIEKAPGRFAAEWLMHPLGGSTVKANARRVLESRPNAQENWSSAERESFRSICKNAMRVLGYPIPF